MIARLCRGADVELGARQEIERPQQILARVAAYERRQPIALGFTGDLGIAEARRIDRKCRTA